MRKLILASASPRRKELLAYLALNFDVFQADVKEDLLVRERPEEAVSRLALLKAETVARNYPDSLVLGSDTLVAIKDSNTKETRILGKPKDKSEAFEMLLLLQGNTHFVYTGFALVNLSENYKFSKVVQSKVKFIKLNNKEIDDYIETSEPMDKAGAYALQGKGAAFIESIEGSYTSVIGLPLSDVYQELKNYDQRKSK